MSIPAIAALGRLDPIEVYQYYDRPVLFACRNVVDGVFLAVLVDEDQSGETWLYVGMSQRRFAHIRSGAISLRDAFRLSEDGTVWEVVVPRDSQVEPFAEPLVASEISDEWLPAPGESLALPTVTLPEFEHSIERQASQTHREVLRVALSFADSLMTEAPAAVLADVLSSLQDVIDAIGVIIDAQERGNGETPPGQRGAIPSGIRKKMELRTISAGPGSFQLELASSSLVDLWGYSEIGLALDEFFQLVNVSNNTEALTERLMTLRARVASKYLEFLEPLRDCVGETQIEWATPVVGPRHQVRILNTDAKAAIETIQLANEYPPEEFELVGELVGANTRNHKFEITCEEAERTRKYEGDVMVEALESVANATLSRRYSATIREVTTLKPITNQTSVAYQLLRLEPFGWQPLDIEEEPVN